MHDAVIPAFLAKRGKRPFPRGGGGRKLDAMQQVFMLVQVAVLADDVEGGIRYQAGFAGQASQRFQMGVNELRQKIVRGICDLFPLQPVACAGADL